MLDDSLRSLLAQYGVGETRSGAILLVDDERPNLTVLRNFLEAGYTVLEAESGLAALKILSEQPIDLVIADQRMPGMSGVELLEQVRELKPDIAGIVLTGYTDPPALIGAINRARVFRFLKKPWQPEEMLETVRQASEHVYQTRAIRNLVVLLARRTGELQLSVQQIESTQRQLLHLERLGTMGRLSAGVVHDLRNVMVSVSYIERELETRNAGADLIESVKVGNQSITNLMHTLETMNQYARAGALQMELSTFSPGSVVKDAVAISRMDLDYRQHRVELDVATDLPSMRGDRQKLTQVMVNLLRNALHATAPRRSVFLKATLDEDEIVLSVEDEGPGVPRELRERIFEPFMSTKGEGGVGMGLYMARLIVEHHRGRLVCMDRPQGGARFEVRLAHTAEEERIPG